jgi:hypothetical protein
MEGGHVWTRGARAPNRRPKGGTRLRAVLTRARACFRGRCVDRAHRLQAGGTITSHLHRKARGFPRPLRRQASKIKGLIGRNRSRGAAVLRPGDVAGTPPRLKPWKGPVRGPDATAGAGGCGRVKTQH